LKCIECNAPVVETVDDSYVCVDCGSEPLSAQTDASTAVREDTPSAADD